MYIEMNLEQMDHFLRHMKLHREELRIGVLKKGPEYLENLKKAQQEAIELIHDNFHICRCHGFEHYKDADFELDVKIPDDLEKHQFREFNYDSFRVSVRNKNALNMGMSEKALRVELEDLEREMESLANAVQDAGVLISLLEEHFNK